MEAPVTVYGLSFLHDPILGRQAPAAIANHALPVVFDYWQRAIVALQHGGSPVGNLHNETFQNAHLRGLSRSCADAGAPYAGIVAVPNRQILVR
jgi:hypothetical protein